MATMIKVENLVKRYGSNYALNDVSFEIGEGEIVGIIMLYDEERKRLERR